MKVISLLFNLLVIATFFYLLISFILWDYDLSKWNVYQRFTYTVLTIIFSIGYIKNEIDKEDKEKI
jgi:Ca2+/Na+ antiporter